MDSTQFFVCNTCGCVESYQFSNGTETCSECTTGQWHGVWAKEPYDPSVHRVNNRINPTPDGQDEESFG